MKIASNDYLSSVPGYSSIYSGGPKGFLKLLVASMRKREHAWVSIVDRYVPNGPVTSSLSHTSRDHTAWIVDLPVPYMRRRITRTTVRRKSTDAAAELIGQIRLVLEREQPDLVFINGLSVFAWALLRAAHAQRIPVIVQHAGIWTIELEQYAHLFSREGLRLMKGMERDFARIPARNIFLNDYSRKVFAQKVGKPAASAAIVIPLPALIGTPRPRAAHRGPKRIGIVARWDRIKNHAAVLELAKAAEAAGSDWEFFAVTKIPDTKVQQDLKRAYREYIEVLPPRSPKALRAFFRRMDLLILPSHFDVSPFVVLEALAEGTPTAISPHVGHANAFRENGAGAFVVDFTSPDQAHAKIQKLLGKPVPRKLVASLRRLHDPSRVLRAYEKLFLDVVSR